MKIISFWKSMTFEDLVKRYEKIEHFVSPAGIIFGFVWHLLYLQRIDLLYDNLLLVFYLFLTGTAIIYLNFYKVKNLAGRFFEVLSILVPFSLQFTIGGLFSSFLIFYGEGGSIAVSWPFFAALFLLLVLNEFYYRRAYQVLIIQVCSYFTVTFLYLVFALPIVLDRIGDSIFLLSGAISLLIIFLFILLVSLVAKSTVRQSRWWLGSGIAAIFIVLNVLYFINIIPPLPLSLKEGTIAHSVIRSGRDWIVQVEPKPWYYFYQSYNPVFHWQPGQRVYLYAAVFAPTNIKTDIFHRWSFYDENLNQWVERSKINYEIVGGQDGGYRGYSYKQSIVPGKWRVDVINTRGQILGRFSFQIIQDSTAPALEKVIY